MELEIVEQMVAYARTGAGDRFDTEDICNELSQNDSASTRDGYNVLDEVADQSSYQHKVVGLPWRSVCLAGQNNEHGCNDREDNIHNNHTYRGTLVHGRELITVLRRGQRGCHSWRAQIGRTMTLATTNSHDMGSIASI